MAKKKQPSKPLAPRPRTDAERRARQSERLGRVLRALRCIMGPGRWDADALADELECSTRTVQRILQTLSMAGVPCRYDSELRSYRVEPGFRFPGIEPSPGSESSRPDPDRILPAAKQLIEDGERFLESLRDYCESLEKSDGK